MKISNAFCHLFYFSFVAIILSPEVGGTTIYLYAIIAALDPFFWLFYWRKNLTKQAALLVAALLASAIPSLSFRVEFGIASIVLCCMYMNYTLQTGRFYLFRYLTVAVAFGLLQLLIVKTFPHLGSLFGPTNIAHMIWGSYATQSFTNLFATDINILPRVSGLSREAGFFAALLGTSTLLFLSQPKLRHRKLILFILAVGLFISFSKITFALLIVGLMWPARRWINAIPMPLTLATALGGLIVLSLAYGEIAFASETIRDRFYGYYLIPHLSSFDLLFGISESRALTEYGYLPFMNTFAENPFLGTGIGYLIVNFGLLFVALATLALYLSGITSFGILVFIASTIDVTPITLDSFVICAWFLAFSTRATGTVLAGKALPLAEA